MNINFLSEEIFQANSQYILVESGHLSRSVQDTLAGLLRDAEVFGVFRHADVSVLDNYKVAYKDTALLFFALAQPSKIPLFLKNQYDDDINNTLTRLVMEGILKIKSGADFVTGPAAQPILFRDQRKADVRYTPRIAALSRKAIEYALELNYLDTAMIAERLYIYNTTPYLHGRFSLLASKGVKSFLGIGNTDPFNTILQKNWSTQSPGKNYNWLMWISRQYANDLNNTQTFKMYISPAVEQLPEVFSKTVTAFAKTKVCCFKVGADITGLLRPDKFVAYFRNFDDLKEAAALLHPELKNVEPHGVPFTAQIDVDGVLSWGVDPPRKEVLENIEGGSWRAMLTDQLASAVIQAKNAALDRTAGYNFICNKISLESIDPDTWNPLIKE